MRKETLVICFLVLFINSADITSKADAQAGYNAAYYGKGGKRIYRFSLNLLYRKYDDLLYEREVSGLNPG
jgi:hypothetical protein